MIFPLSRSANRRTNSVNSRFAGLFRGKISPAKMRKFQYVGYILDALEEFLPMGLAPLPSQPLERGNEGREAALFLSDNNKQQTFG